MEYTLATPLYEHLPQVLLINVVAIPVLPHRPVRPILWTTEQENACTPNTSYTQSVVMYVAHKIGAMYFTGNANIELQLVVPFFLICHEGHTYILKV